MAIDICGKVATSLDLAYRQPNGNAAEAAQVGINLLIREHGLGLVVDAVLRYYDTNRSPEQMAPLLRSLLEQSNKKMGELMESAMEKPHKGERTVCEDGIRV